MSQAAPRVSGVVIGNEVLTGKVTDANGAHLARRCWELGVRLSGMAFVPDEVDAIVEAITQARRRAELVVTSGGVGPTHDDVTVRAVALALGRRVVRQPELVRLVEGFYRGAPVPPAALRLAEGPEGAALLTAPALTYPVLHCQGVYLLPGVPALFARQLEAVLGTVQGQRLVLGQLFLDADEPSIAALLDALAAGTPRASIGSYPVFDAQAGFKVKVTVEHVERAVVLQVMDALEAGLPLGTVLRTERP